MKINTVITDSFSWKIKVHTAISQYQGQGKYWTNCSIVYQNGGSVNLISRYTKDEQSALNVHKMICVKAKALFDLEDIE